MRSRPRSFAERGTKPGPPGCRVLPDARMAGADRRRQGLGGPAERAAGSRWRTGQAMDHDSWRARAAPGPADVASWVRQRGSGGPTLVSCRREAGGAVAVREKGLGPGRGGPVRVVRILGTPEPGGAQLSALQPSVALRRLGVATTLLAGDATRGGWSLPPATASRRRPAQPAAREVPAKARQTCLPPTSARRGADRRPGRSAPPTRRPAGPCAKNMPTRRAASRPTWSVTARCAGPDPARRRPRAGSRRAPARMVL